jgi:hypothetical protein
MRRMLAILVAMMFVALTASATKQPYTHMQSKRAGTKVTRSKNRSLKNKSFRTKSFKTKSHANKRQSFKSSKHGRR